MSEQLALLPERLIAHLQLTLVALFVGVLVALPTGILVTRRRRLEPALLGLASIVQTIPSLALLAMMVPALAALAVLARSLGLELRSIGYPPAILALSLYSVLPVLRNTVAGIRGVDPFLIEAARGVGMTPAQRLWRVELPLALPVIVAGVRTAAVWVVGTATLSTPVGATSLGNFIFSGLQTRNFRAVAVGCLAAAALALALDALVAALERGVRERRPGLTWTALTVTLALTLGTAASFAWGGAPGRGAPVRIGSKPFTEQYILAELLSGWIEEETGRPARVLSSLGSTVAFDALREDQIDLYVDYSGTVWATLMKRPGLPGSRQQVLDETRAWLAREHGIGLVAALGFQNTYALGMSRARAAELGVRRIGELRPWAPRLEIAGDFEFFGRAEWKALVREYDLHFRVERSMDSALLYQAVVAGEADVISAYSTDGRIAAYDLVLLEDERSVIPPYDAILLAGPRFRREHPEIVASLGRLEGSLDEARMQRLNLAVDEAGETPRVVARRALRALRAAPGSGESRPR